MKKTALLILALVFVSSIISCSKDEISKDNNLLGVWEATNFEGSSLNTLKLVFGSKNSGLKILNVTSVEGEITSTALSYDWGLSGSSVIIIGDTLQETYTINPEGQLIPTTSNQVVLDKVSEDYSKYY